MAALKNKTRGDGVAAVVSLHRKREAVDLALRLAQEVDQAAFGAYPLHQPFDDTCLPA